MPQDQGPPTGTVTCLFTDIEGSTRIELEVGTGPYRDVRERHRELLRTASVAHDGFEQSTEGDSFFLIFRRPLDAVAAAVDAQRALAAESWPDGVDVHVRMGIHTGEIESIGGDVIGYDINRTARIAALAHGGQVLLSDTTRALVADDFGRRTSRYGTSEHTASRTSAHRSTSASWSSRDSRTPSRRCARSTPGRTTCRRS